MNCELLAKSPYLKSVSDKINTSRAWYYNIILVCGVIPQMYLRVHGVLLFAELDFNNFCTSSFRI